MGSFSCLAFGFTFIIMAFRNNNDILLNKEDSTLVFFVGFTYIIAGILMPIATSIIEKKWGNK
jgi:hypothetical protein